MISGKLDKTMYNIIMESQPKGCITVSRKSSQTMHNVIKKIKPKDA